MPVSVGPAAVLGGVGEADDAPITNQSIKPGILRRIIPYTRPYRWMIALLLSSTTLDALIAGVTPILTAAVIDKGMLPGRLAVVVWLVVVLALLALVNALAGYFRSWSSAKIGEGLVYDLRTQVFAHVQEQPLAFFIRSETGALVSRLNTDVIGAEQAITTLLSQTVNTILTMIFVTAAMFYLSWQVAIISVIVIPLFFFPGRIIGRRLQKFTRETMQLNAVMGSLMNERFNVSGAALVKLFGRPAEENATFAKRAARVRDIGVQTNVTAQALGIAMTLVASLIVALMFGVGGALVIKHVLQLGTLVAFVTLLVRMYGPIDELSSMQGNILAALVSFDRVFEVLDLRPLVAERSGAVALPAQRPGEEASPEIVFDRVSFRYPTASEISLASLESIALPLPERVDDAWVLHEVSFRAPGGKLTALVGPSGAGKSTITQLVPRFYDPGAGVVRIGGHDIRDLTMQSVRDTVGVATQDAHLFHDTIRVNLAYARPKASEAELVEACKAAQIWDLIMSLPDGLDTVVGDRGFRMSGGEKQRIALARLLLKAPPVIVLDEATAHLDSASEAAIQRALDTALAGRTALVIAHRLSTIHRADQILVINAGQIIQRGTHEELMAAGGLYADLYRTQFFHQEELNGRP